MKIFFTALAMSLLMLSVAVAQNQRPQRQGGGRPGGGGGGPGSPGSSTLERAGLKVGQAIPDLKIYDADGKEFRTADLKGKHSVVTFGCLT